MRVQPPAGRSPCACSQARLPERKRSYREKSQRRLVADSEQMPPLAKVPPASRLLRTIQAGPKDLSVSSGATSACGKLILRR